MLRLQPIYDESHQRFMCLHEGHRLIVTPSLSLAQDSDRVPVHVVIDGVPHVLFTEYNIDSRLREIYMYAPDGPYQAYRGPRLGLRCIEVELDVFDKHFSIVLWKRDRGALWSKQVKGIGEMIAELKEGWFREPVPEKIEDAEFINVARDGAMVRERNPFYVPSAPEGAV